MASCLQVNDFGLEICRALIAKDGLWVLGLLAFLGGSRHVGNGTLLRRPLPLLQDPTLTIDAARMRGDVAPSLPILKEHLTLDCFSHWPESAADSILSPESLTKCH